jgi:hypothetical protein
MRTGPLRAAPNHPSNRIYNAMNKAIQQRSSRPENDRRATGPRSAPAFNPSQFPTINSRFTSFPDSAGRIAASTSRCIAAPSPRRPVTPLPWESATSDRKNANYETNPLPSNTLWRAGINFPRLHLAYLAPALRGFVAPFAFCLLPFAVCLLLVAFLPFAFCPLPFAFFNTKRTHTQAPLHGGRP